MPIFFQIKNAPAASTKTPMTHGQIGGGGGGQLFVRLQSGGKVVAGTTDVVVLDDVAGGRPSLSVQFAIPTVRISNCPLGSLSAANFRDILSPTANSLLPRILLSLESRSI